MGLDCRVNPGKPGSDVHRAPDIGFWHSADTLYVCSRVYLGPQKWTRDVYNLGRARNT